MEEKLRRERDDAEVKAWDSLARYKFQMFGYWAAIWVHLNRLCADRQPNPFAGLVRAARQQDIWTPQAQTAERREIERTDPEAMKNLKGGL